MTARAEAPADAAPLVEDPAAEAPASEAPQAEAPAAEAPQTEAPQTEAPAAETPQAKALTSPRPLRRSKRPWAKTKALGAVLAIGVMLTGAALPAINPSGEPAVATTASGATAAGAAQSYTAKDTIRAEVSARGTFTATTPEEVKETRSRAVAAAIAAGMPLGSAVDIPVADRIVMPMADGTYSFTDGFGASRPGRSHLGQDFAAPIGSPINAAMKGCVSRSTESYQGYGVTIQIESIVDGKAVSTVYSHMTYGSRQVEVGDCVDAGQYIGDVGSTGYVFGSCLHFEVHINNVAINPLPWLEENVT